MPEEASRRGCGGALYFVLVTDDPAEGRSCFQAVALRDYVATSDVPLTVDLHEIEALDIYPSTVAEHEAVARSLFGALASHRLPPRRVPAKGTGDRPRASDVRGSARD